MAYALALRKSGRAIRLLPFTPSELEKIFSAMLESAARPDSSLELALLDDAAMEALNNQSLGCAGPTNILAFPALRNPALSNEAQEHLGSLALSVDTLRRECFLYGQEAREHCIRLLAHGLAHLLGYEHGPAMDALGARLEQAALKKAEDLSSHSAS